MNQTKVIFRFGDVPFQKIRAVEDGYVRKLINQPLELVRPVVHD
jgi:hypothetical protein